MIKDRYLEDLFNEQLHELSKTDQGRMRVRVVGLSYVKLSQVYAAVEFPDNSIQAVMMKVRISAKGRRGRRGKRGKRYWYGYLYREIEEPYKVSRFDSCPEKILKLLTEPVNEHSVSWRERNWNKINKRKSFPKFKKEKVLVIEYKSGSKDIFYIKKINAHSLYLTHINKEYIAGIFYYTYSKSKLQQLMDNGAKVYTDDLLELEYKTAQLG